MKRFVYFLPGLPGVNAALLKTRGLFDRFAPEPGDEAPSGLIAHCVRGVDVGPGGAGGGKGGCLLAAGETPPDAVVGNTLGDPEKFLAAMEGDTSTPGPDDLARRIGIAGSQLKLADGRFWRVPLLRKWDPEKLASVAALPEVLRPDIAGGEIKYRRVVAPPYAAADALGQKLFSVFVAEQTMKLGELIPAACQVLSVNYRIGVEEAGLLGLFDEDLATRVLTLAVDIDSLMAQARSMATQGLVRTDPTVEQLPE